MTTPTPNTTSKPNIIQWLLDTRPLWPVPPQLKSREAVGHLKTVASRSLSLLHPTEQASVLRYYHLKDAKMSLASHLLKHLVIAKYASTSWEDSVVSRDMHGKPCFLPRSPSDARLDFNVSHQAGIVSLIAAVGIGDGEKIEVGTDVVCWNERLAQDYRNIDAEGFFNWVDIHADVFSTSELSYMKLAPVDIDMATMKDVIAEGFGRDKISRCQRRDEALEIAVDIDGKTSNVQVLGNEVIDKKLRRFYACWCLRETYIKMTGEALLAPWLKDLEILDVKEPLEIGTVESNFKIIFKGKLITNVLMELVALGNGFMVGGAVRPRERAEELRLKLGTWEHLNLENDILSFAESKESREVV